MDMRLHTVSRGDMETRAPNKRHQFDVTGVEMRESRRHDTCYCKETEYSVGRTYALIITTCQPCIKAKYCCGNAFFAIRLAGGARRPNELVSSAPLDPTGYLRSLERALSNVVVWISTLVSLAQIYILDSLVLTNQAFCPTDSYAISSGPVRGVHPYGR